MCIDTKLKEENWVAICPAGNWYKTKNKQTHHKLVKESFDQNGALVVYYMPTSFGNRNWLQVMWLWGNKIWTQDSAKSPMQPCVLHCFPRILLENRAHPGVPGRLVHSQGNLSPCGLIYLISPIIQTHCISFTNFANKCWLQLMWL